MRPAWAQSWRWKSSRELTTASEGKYNCVRATERGEEVWNESASRWTKTKYEALSAKASGHIIAKLLWSKVDGVDLAVVQRRTAFLPGEISFASERMTTLCRSEKSADAVVTAFKG